MAAPGRKFIGALARYGRESTANKDQLTTWKGEALAEIAANKGGHIASGSANGVAFTQMVTMTNAEWFYALDMALQWVEADIQPSSRTYTRIR